MQQAARQKISMAFWLLSLLDIVGISCSFEPLHYIAKPLLVPALILLMFNAPGGPGKKLLLAGLIFSWMGDVFLMFENRYPLFFIPGLVCFLTTHVFYIIYFLNIRPEKVSLLKKQPLLVVPVLAYGTGLVWFLFPHLGNLTVPVIVYATVICTMLICSMHAYAKLDKGPANAFLLGAASFVLSDSLLAINKFYQPIPFAGIWIMLTYCAAQYFIVTGFVKRAA